MAFCNNRAPCGSDCGRQDDHGGDCDCREDDCKSCSEEIVPEKPKGRIVLYAVTDGKNFYRSGKKHTSAGWYPNIKDASIWNRPGPAKGMVTMLSTHDFAPILVELVVTEINVIDQHARVSDVRKKQERKLQKQDEVRKHNELLRAQKELRDVQDRLNRLSRIY